MHSAASSKLIELNLRDLNQLFNSMDPSPFREKDLDADAEEFIVGSAMEAERDQALMLMVHVEKPPARGLEAAEQVVRDAINHYFVYLAMQQRRKLSELMRFGRKMLFIGAAFLTGCIVASRLVGAVSDSPFMAVVQESLFIVGWVAMWRPLEVFLYDWWPLVRLRKLFERMSVMEVCVRVRPPGNGGGGSA